MMVTIELTDEQVEWAKRQVEILKGGATWRGNEIMCAIVAALPQPTLRERAYKVVHPYGRAGYQENHESVADMARWLYENAGKRAWSVGWHPARDKYEAEIPYATFTYHDSLVDAYARVVVGLGESA